jgi:hypothetical protein
LSPYFVPGSEFWPVDLGIRFSFAVSANATKRHLPVHAGSPHFAQYAPRRIAELVLVFDLVAVLSISGSVDRIGLAHRVIISGIRIRNSAAPPTPPPSSSQAAEFLPYVPLAAWTKPRSRPRSRPGQQRTRRQHRLIARVCSPGSGSAPLVRAMAPNSHRQYALAIAACERSSASVPACRRFLEHLTNSSRAPLSGARRRRIISTALSRPFFLPMLARLGAPRRVPAQRFVAQNRAHRIRGAVFIRIFATNPRPFTALARSRRNRTQLPSNARAFLIAPEDIQHRAVTASAP